MALIECVPNISEGQDTGIINKLTSSLATVKGLEILDVSSDLDHHRTVFTFIGYPSAITSGAFLLAKEAIRLIDLNKHRGVHPRHGVVDVLPLIPLVGITIEECLALALQIKQQLESKLSLPCLLYGEMGGYPSLPQLRHKIKTDNRQAPYPTGVCCLGVRDFLIAYNLVINTTKLGPIQEIAHKIRESNGGLPGVRALAFFLAGEQRVQLSMNITKTKMISLEEVYQWVEKETVARGLIISGSEIVGLTPTTVWREAKNKYPEEFL